VNVRASGDPDVPGLGFRIDTDATLGAEHRQRRR
jgi:hypothetical protein